VANKKRCPGNRQRFVHSVSGKVPYCIRAKAQV